MTPQRYNQINELFLRVADQTEARREQILQSECEHDPELRREVESLLRHDKTETLIRSAQETEVDLHGSADTERVAPPPNHRPFNFIRPARVSRNVGPNGMLAIGGLCCCVLFALLAYFGQLRMRQFQKDLRREALNEIVDGKTLSLRMWLDHETEKTESWARSNQLREAIDELAKRAGDQDPLPTDFADESLQQQVRSEITVQAGREQHFAIWDRRFRLIADSIPGGNRIGMGSNPWGAGILAEVFQGKTKLFAFDKHRSITPLEREADITPHLAVVVPIRNSNGSIIAALQIHDDRSPEKSTQIVRTNQLGTTGETYVFNRDGLMLTTSRFEQQLERAGLIDQGPNDSRSATIYLRDPGGDITTGYRVGERLDALPLTKMARSCITGGNGDDLDGYRDYRGVQVFGAWRWLDDLQIGIATEIDVDEADRSMQVMRMLSWIILFLIAFCICVALGSFYSVQRLRSGLDPTKQLGPYRIGNLIGEGGMGRVYQAEHQLLKRATAIKLLRPELVDSDSIARFEREAQIVSRLEHPNTIRVFDYGVTDDNVFYLVMELINGLNLAQLVNVEIQLSPARAIHLLRQILFSLREAHHAGVVHRDLKPGNVMVSNRGGVSDMVKVLDFGLVKPILPTDSEQITATALVAGTPQYLAPERWSHPEINDPRSDLFAWAAIGFNLLTGQNAIKGHSMTEIIHHLINDPPRRPSAETTQVIPRELDDLIHHCLAINPEQRPESAQQIIDRLDQIQTASGWTQSDANEWWNRFSHQ